MICTLSKLLTKLYKLFNSLNTSTRMIVFKKDLNKTKKQKRIWFLATVGHNFKFDISFDTFGSLNSKIK